MKVYSSPTKQYVHIAEIPLSEIERAEIDVCRQPSESVTAYYNRQETKPDLLTNLGLFGMSGGIPCFGLVSKGKTYAYDGQHIIGFGVTPNGELRFGLQKERSWDSFCSAYPMLICDFKKTEIEYAKELNYSARRTCIGMTYKALYAICVDAPGATFSDLQTIGEALDLRYMMNADGGGSTAMIAKGTEVTNGYFGRPVDNVFAVYLKKESKPDIFSEGDKVRVKNAVQYATNEPFRTWFDTYTIISVSGDRAVIGVNGVITTAINTTNLEKVIV